MLMAGIAWRCDRFHHWEQLSALRHLILADQSPDDFCNDHTRLGGRGPPCNLQR